MARADSVVHRYLIPDHPDMPPMKIEVWSTPPARAVRVRGVGELPAWISPQ